MAKTEGGLRVPPQNEEAERSVLSALLLDKDAIIKVADILEPEDFYFESHATIYRAILTLFEKRLPIDLVTLSDALEKEKALDRVGGASFLTNLVDIAKGAVNVAAWAEIVRNKSMLRKMIQAASKIMELGYEENEDIEQVLDEAEKNLFAVSQRFIKQYFVPIKDVLADTFDRIDELHKQKGKLRGIPTGFHELDNLLAGLQSSDLITLASRPSMGKSSLALNIASNCAIEQKIPVGIFSLEMSKDQLIDRLLVSVAQIDSWKLRTGNLSDDDFPKIGYAMGLLSEAPIFIDDSPALNLVEIRTKARRLQMEHGVGLIVVDYLQLIEGRKRSSDINRVQEISEISRGLKALARELNVPVLAISQLSRAVELRSPKIPQLADLRDSGSIEQDSDIVIFIYREDYYNPQTKDKNIADILIKKHRHGPIGDVKLYFAPERMSFRDLETKRVQESLVEKQEP